MEQKRAQLLINWKCEHVKRNALKSCAFAPNCFRTGESAFQMTLTIDLPLRLAVDIVLRNAAVNMNL